ncbi:hypothetical protein WAI453_005721 [Rhynchosporium graminicola]|uniref:Uncharacterized protein n=1 Tax=Rhynchosporium graminicola TaxID=2792576 RepID=A0A1E1KKN8_9HELO|nr:uncharacterized protein RCO7_04111 [Rhynchosporium commune]
MTSRQFAEGAFLYPESSPDPLAGDEKIQNHRHPTVYDAVAGRISLAGFIPKQVIVASTRDTVSSSTSAIAPEAVLFRGKNAPTRYAESDIYFTNERKSTKDLPESDILKALHCYTSEFYSRATADGGSGDWKSLDETALIALGILLEEASLASLGNTGDLAFTEGERSFDDPKKNNNRELRRLSKRPAKKQRLAPR